MNTLELGNLQVGEGQPVFIIAEIGINHQGDVNIARELVTKAKECGANAIKLQKRSISRILTKEGLEMVYDNQNSFGQTYGEHKKALELSDSDYHVLNTYCRELDIIFSASGWDEESIDFLDELGVPFFKISSADMTNFPLLTYTAQKNKPMIMSTGMANLEMVKSAYSLVQPINNQIAILQCTSTYPSYFSEIHLNVLRTYMKEFPNVVIGYSGHEQGIAIPPAAVALGAKIIERHFTLDRTMKGSDHAASLEPQGFSKMVRNIRAIEEAMGSSQKEIQKSESTVFKKLSKSIVSAVEITSGTPITIDMLTTKGPGTGISPMRINELVGKTSNRDIPADQVIANEDIQWQT